VLAARCSRKTQLLWAVGGVLAAAGAGASPRAKCARLATVVRAGVPEPAPAPAHRLPAAPPPRLATPATRQLTGRLWAARHQFAHTHLYPSAAFPLAGALDLIALCGARQQQ